MLVSLRIRNLALIEDLTWNLAPGFNLLTGETGAGKSILIDAISLLVGERADKGLIRSGADSCTVEGELHIEPAARLDSINALLADLGAEPCDGPALLIKRSLTAAGSGRQFINGSAVTLQNLRQLGNILVDVHGPHDHQSLLVSEKQTELLDSYGQLAPRRIAYGKVYRELRGMEAEMESRMENVAALEEKKERLRRESQEIQSAALKAHEDVTLEGEYRAASNAESLRAHAALIINHFQEDDHAVLTQMAHIQRALTAWKRIDETVAPLEDTNRRLIDEVHDLIGEVQNRVESIESDPARIREMEDRLNLIHSLKRKYASGALAGLDEVIARGERSASELASLESGDDSTEKMEKRLKEVQVEVARMGGELTEARRAVAAPLAGKITQELQVLGFKKALLNIEFHPVSGAMGCERAEFMFAPNLGETPRPLRAIASSGEMARVMLALKTTLAEVDQVPILIFDEVDANVGGETAMEVGKKMRNLGLGHQVLCITHLPQVASQGQHHFAVEKVVQGGRTSTALRFLERADREREIARMLGGQTEAALALAKSLLDSALK